MGYFLEPHGRFGQWVQYPTHALLTAANSMPAHGGESSPWQISAYPTSHFGRGAVTGTSGYPPSKKTVGPRPQPSSSGTPSLWFPGRPAVTSRDDPPPERQRWRLPSPRVPPQNMSERSRQRHSSKTGGVLLGSVFGREAPRLRWPSVEIPADITGREQPRGEGGSGHQAFEVKKSSSPTDYWKVELSSRSCRAPVACHSFSSPPERSDMLRFPGVH